MGLLITLFLSENITMSLLNKCSEYVKLPELICVAGFAALSIPCYREAARANALADSIESTNPSQSDYIRTNAALPEGLGDTFAGTAIVTALLNVRRRREVEGAELFGSQ